jgi:hypothetical protein
MEQAARSLGTVAPIESIRSRPALATLTLTLEVVDPEVVAELRRQPEGADRDRYALAALRVGVLALRMAGGQIDVASIREAGHSLIAEVRELLSSRAAEIHERVAAALTHHLDAQSGTLPQRLQALLGNRGELERLLRAHVGPDESVLARSLAAHVGEGSPLFRLLTSSDESGLRGQLAAVIEQALTEQRQQILREFSLDQKDSALSRLLSEFSLDDERSTMTRLSKMLAAASDQIGKNLTLDDENSALARLKRELEGTIQRLVRDNIEFQSQVREAIARIDTRRKEDALSPRHGLDFEARLGALLAAEAHRCGDVHEATGGQHGLIKNCKVGDHVIELGLESAAAHARVVWEAKDKRGMTVRAALDELAEARRNRQAQVGVFVFSKATAPEGLTSLQRHGSDILAAWDSEDASGDVTLRAAYSLARALAVRERRSENDDAAMGQVERAARSVERQLAILDDIHRWAETVKGHGEKIAERSARMREELRHEVELLDSQIALMRRAE